MQINWLNNFIPFSSFTTTHQNLNKYFEHILGVNVSVSSAD